MTIDMKTQISEVTVFRDGARVTRTGKSKIKQGENIIIVGGISRYASDESFRVKGKGAAILKGIDVTKKTTTYEPEEDVSALLAELKKLENSNGAICRVGHQKVVMDIMKMKGLDVSEHTDMLNRGCQINESNWNTHYPIYAFDLTKYPGDALFTGSSEIMVHFERDDEGYYPYNTKTATNGIGASTVLPGDGDKDFTLYAVLHYEKVVELSMNQNESSIVIR